MFEAMMAKFQEDTVRFLFRMQIIGPDGRPINVPPPPPRGEVPAAPPVDSAEQPMLVGDGHGLPGLREAPQREIPIHTRAPQTTDYRGSKMRSCGPGRSRRIYPLGFDSGYCIEMDCDERVS